jgi:hypothetical protein
MPEDNAQLPLTEEPKPEQEEATTEEEQAQEPEVSVAEIQSQLKNMQGELEESNKKYKDLSGQLTRVQQEKAELYRFHRSTLPKINKSFAEQWEENPETAVNTAVQDQVVPTQQELMRLKAKQAETHVLVTNPEWGKYRETVVSLGDQYPQLTTTEEGIQALYEMAEARELKSENKRLRSNGEAEVQKRQAYTEESSTRPPAKKQKKKLTASQRLVAQNLGIPEEQYVKQLERIET